MSLFSLVLGIEGGSVMSLYIDYCHLVFASQNCRLSLRRTSQQKRHSKQVQLHSVMGVPRQPPKQKHLSTESLGKAGFLPSRSSE